MTVISKQRGCCFKPQDLLPATDYQNMWYQMKSEIKLRRTEYIEDKRSENESDPEGLRAEQGIGEMIEDEEDESRASPVCFNRCLSEDLLCARP